MMTLLTSSRTKEKLRSGELMVSGDQWPIFLYHGNTFDMDDPWNGLCRSHLLVSVSFLSVRLPDPGADYLRPINLYLHLPVPLKQRPNPPVLEMPGSME